MIKHATLSFAGWNALRQMAAATGQLRADNEGEKSRPNWLYRTIQLKSNLHQMTNGEDSNDESSSQKPYHPSDACHHAEWLT